MSNASELVAYKDAMIVLGTASVLVPFVVRRNISPILGFLLAGVLLGPYGLGRFNGFLPAIEWFTITDSASIAKISELGVVLLLFLIGIELSWPRLLTMRRLVFGLGTLQVVASTVLIGGALAALGWKADAALVVAAALALSSTAIVIEVLSRQHRLGTTTGRTTFAVLLLQDLAVVPILLLVGILGAKEAGTIATGLMLALLQGTIVVTLIVLVGRRLLRPLYRSVAITESHELFVAATLFVVVGASLASAAAGLSMALGSFIAGLLLADTEYRRAIEAVVEPFKGLLLGVFFFSVGTNLDLGLVASEPQKIVAGTIALILGKAALAAALCRLFGKSWASALETGLLLGPSGEFAFVVLALASSYGIVGPELGSRVLAVGALAMATIPFVAMAARWLADVIEGRQPPPPELAIEPDPLAAPKAIVVGHGRVGQLVASMLDEQKVAHLATDRDPAVVTRWRREGRPVFFGDARQAGFLEKCGIATATTIIITIHTANEIDDIVHIVRELRPDIVIVSRAKDAQHARHLYDLGVTDAVPETIEASLQLSEAALVELGIPMGAVIAAVHQRRDDYRKGLKGQNVGNVEARAFLSRRKL